MIGAAFGEPFHSRLALAVRDVMELLPGGLRRIFTPASAVGDLMPWHHGFLVSQALSAPTGGFPPENRAVSRPDKTIFARESGCSRLDKTILR